MRLGIGFVVMVSLIGCRERAEPTPVANHPASKFPSVPQPKVPPATPPSTATCIPPDFGGVVSYFAADNAAVTLCLRRGVQWKGHGEAMRCLRLDVISGAYVDAPLAAPPPPPSPAVHLWDTARTVEICQLGQQDCVKLDLKPLPDLKEEPRETYELALSADQTRAVATIPGGQNGFVILDAKTGKRVAAPALTEAERCLSRAAWAGNTVFVPASACNGSPTAALLYDKDGQLLEKLDRLDVEWSYPVQIAGDRWAIAGESGNGIELVDMSSGKQLGLVAKTPQYTPPCPYCGALDVTTGGDVPLVTASPAGRIFEVASGIVMFDAQVTKIEKHFPLPLCDKPEGPPPPR